MAFSKQVFNTLIVVIASLLIILTVVQASPVSTADKVRAEATAPAATPVARKGRFYGYPYGGYGGYPYAGYGGYPYGGGYGGGTATASAVASASSGSVGFGK